MPQPADKRLVTEAALAAAGIGSGTVADGAVVTAKLADAAVTSAKIGAAQVTSAKIADGAVTVAKSTGLVPDTRTVAGKALTANVTLAKADVGLANVDNTSDASKPISAATATALNARQQLAEKGQAGGYAGLDADGDVLDASGAKVVAGAATAGIPSNTVTRIEILEQGDPLVSDPVGQAGFVWLSVGPRL